MVLLVTATVLVLSLPGVICSIANCRILSGTPDDFHDPPNGRIYLEGEPPYPYIPTQTPKGPFGIPTIPIGPED